MAQKEGSKETRFKPGKSGNPKGRPKGESLTTILKRLGEIEDQKFDGETISRKEAVGHRVWQLALKGDTRILTYLYDRLDGRPTERHEHTGEDGGDINFRVTFVGDDPEGEDDT